MNAAVPTTQPRSSSTGRRPVVGPLLLIIAVVHVLVTPFFYAEAVTSIIDGGVLGAVEADASVVDLRSAGFWYVTSGIALALIGADVAWIERRHDRIPAHVPWMLLALGAFAVALMPVSPFWLFFVAAALAARSRPRRAGSAPTDGATVQSRTRELVRTWRPWAAPAAGLWSLAVTVVGALWTTGVVAAPFGTGDPRATHVGSVFEGVGPEQVGWIASVVGTVGLLTAVAAWRLPARAWLAVPALGLGLVFLLIVPDVRVVQNFAYLFFGYTGLWDAALGAMLISMAGGALWLLVALGQFVGDRSLRTIVRVPRWSVAITYVAAALALPYGIVRALWGLGIPLGTTAAAIDGFPWWQRLGLVLIFGGLPVGGAVLTLGLVRPWGRTFPRWLPRLAGRRVPIWFAVVPGTIASVLILQMGLLVTPGAIAQLNEMTGTTWGADLPGLFFLPWGIALAIAVYAYAATRLEAGHAQRDGLGASVDGAPGPGED